MTTDTRTLTETKSITIGWTINTAHAHALGYSSFTDGYRHGVPQVVIPIEVEVAAGHSPESIADLVFDALNNPEPYGPALAILRAVTDTGYNGKGAHFSLSVGDTVEVDGVRLACQSLGWKVL